MSRPRSPKNPLVVRLVMHLGRPHRASTVALMLLSSGCESSSESSAALDAGRVLDAGAEVARMDSGPAELPRSDAGRDAAPMDAAPRVKDQPAPRCHDLEATGPLIVPTADPSPPPSPQPLRALTDGRYELRSVRFHGIAQVPADASPTRTTVEVAGGKQYFAQNTGTDAGVGAQRLTLVWQLTEVEGEARLFRTILCPERTPATTVVQRIDAAPNGFTLYVDTGNRIAAHRYEKVD